jgi:hypothetical protein
MAFMGGRFRVITAKLSSRARRIVSYAIGGGSLVAG